MGILIIIAIVALLIFLLSKVPKKEKISNSDDYSFRRSIRLYHPYQGNYCHEFGYKIPQYVVIDTETSGLKAGRNEILQLSAIRYNTPTGERINSFNSLLRPSDECVIEDRALVINHLTRQQLQQAPAKNQVLQEFIDFIGDDVLVGYNVGFDLEFLAADLDLVGIECPSNRYYDVYSDVRIAGLPTVNNKLQTVAEHFGYTTRFHDSMNDCEATNYVFRNLNPELFKHIVICQIDKEGQELANYDSIQEASDASGAPFNGIAATLQGSQKTSGGYKWVKKEEK